MKSLLIIGAGGHGQVVFEIAQSLGYEIIDFLDDNYDEAIGKIDDIEKFLEYENAFCGIGNNQFRGVIIDRLQNAGYKIPALIHQTAYVSISAIVEDGVVIEPKAIVNAHSVIKTGSIISVGAIVDHDVVIGKCAHINSGSIVKAGGSVDDYEKLEAGEVRLGYSSAVVKRQ